MKPHEFTEKTIAFLGTMGVKPTKPKFYVEINFDSKGKPASVYSSATDTVIRIQIYPTEWQLLALDPKRESCATYYADSPPYVDADALRLFKKKPTIDQIPSLFRAAEKKLGVTFPRIAFVRTNLAGAKKSVTEWAKTL